MTALFALFYMGWVGDRIWVKEETNFAIWGWGGHACESGEGFYSSALGQPSLLGINSPGFVPQCMLLHIFSCSITCILDSLILCLDTIR